VVALGGNLVDVELDFEKRYRLVREIIETIVLTVLMFLIIRLAVQNFNIDGMSMEPGLHNQELILVDKWSYLFHAPVRGDTIVFVAPPNPTQDYIKRIIGLPGDVITIQNTTVYVNGKKLTEPYVDPHRQGNPYPSFSNRIVPDDAYFVLGDNRGGSSDSRDWGCVPKKNVIGQAALVYWPLGQNNNGLLANFTYAFANIPPPPVALKSSNMCPMITNIHTPAMKSSPHDGGMLTMNMFFMMIMPGLFVGFSGRRKRSS
jgi:signal peptidase I